MRIAVGLMKHESNSFNPNPTTIADFHFQTGAEMELGIPKLQGTSLQGMMRFFKERAVELIPIGFARAKNEGGFVTIETYQLFKETFLDGLKSAGELDGICLDLHGSMTVAGLGDAEGDLLESIRSIVGQQIPVVSALDLHAMVTEKMVVNLDGIIGYRTAPHIDQIEIGEKVAEMLYDSIQEDSSLTMAAVSIPMLVSGEQSETAKEPMASLLKEVVKTDQLSGMVSSSYFLGFPWADVSYNQGCALVVTQGDQKLATKEAIRLAQIFWEYHQDFNFTTPAYTMETALQLVSKSKNGPFFICDSGDNPGAGGSENITEPFEQMIAFGVQDALYAVIADQVAYEKCTQTEVGSVVQLSLGQQNLTPVALPTQVEGVLQSLGESLGMSAAVVRVQGVDLVITPDRMMMTNPEFLLRLGLEIEKYHLIVLKSGYLDPKYYSYAKEIYLGLTPGYTDQTLKNLNFTHVPRPIYPLDEEFDFDPKSKLFSLE